MNQFLQIIFLHAKQFKSASEAADFFLCVWAKLVIMFGSSCSLSLCRLFSNFPEMLKHFCFNWWASFEHEINWQRRSSQKHWLITHPSARGHSRFGPKTMAMLLGVILFMACCSDSRERNWTRYLDNKKGWLNRRKHRNLRRVKRCSAWQWALKWD